jgi:endonuclease/exonuclease/phosphatase family metal-dependent hydrolase
MSYNIRFGGVGREERIAEVIRQAAPDLVVLQEATHPHVVERLAELTQMPHWAAKRKHSVAFLSRLPVASHNWRYHRQLERAVLDIEIDGLRVLGVHLRATHSNLTERGRMREVRAILEFVEDYADEFHVLTGDLNTLAPGERLNMEKLPTRYKILAFMLGGRIAFRAIQLMLDAGYLDAYRKFHLDPGFTFPAWDPHVRLDYLFTPEKFIDRIKGCSVMTDIAEPAKATDHLPLLAEIAVA